MLNLFRLRVKAKKERRSASHGVGAGDRRSDYHQVYQAAPDLGKKVVVAIDDNRE
jgi:hypothetical protein